MNKPSLKFVLLTINIVALLCAIAWFYTARDWEPFITSLSFGAALIGVIKMKEKLHEQGRGGNAIFAGKNAKIDLINEGIVSAGKGGSGGSGGDAIHVSSDVKITIINKGVIAGGDAGIKQLQQHIRVRLTFHIAAPNPSIPTLSQFNRLLIVA